MNVYFERNIVIAMDIISSPSANAVLNGVVEVLFRMYYDVNSHWSSLAVQAVFVSASTFIGASVAGHLGMIAGGIIGSELNTYLGPAVLTLRKVILQLDVVPIQNLFTLLWTGIKNLVNRNILLAEFLEMFGRESSVRLHILEIITNILTSVHDSPARQIEV